MCITVSAAGAQEIKWKNLSFGVTAQYLFTDGDLNKFWGNTLAGGVLFNYKIDDSFSLEGGLLGTYLKPKSDPDRIPNFIFLNIPAGLKYSLEVNRRLKFNIFSGIQNHSFIYSGEAAELVEENDIEHELGLFIQAGIEVLTFKNIGVELNTKIQNVFTLPDQLKIINLGLTIYFY
ncbi:MAG: hypothetical protein D8M61_04490 [Ignavibacteriae bacterium]|nr:hypothetical protein [Ignavibacteriota bacterium]